MKINRIYAIVLKIMYFFTHSYDRLADAFYWPIMDLLLWGLTSTYFKNSAVGGSKIIMIVVSGILLWIIVWRGQYEITVNLLDDLWDRNLINIFASPLKFSEWISAFIVVGLIKAALSLVFATGVAYLLYKTNLYVLGFNLIPFIFLLILTGWWAGFFIAGVILRFGSKVQTFAWGMIYLISPFSAIYYPIATLPGWAQKISLIVPTSYVFEGAREVINKGILDYKKLLISLVLNIFYLILALIFLRKSFDKVLDKGLVKVF